MDATLLNTSRLSVSDGGSHKRLSSTHSRNLSEGVLDALAEKEDAARRSYEYIKQRPRTSEINCPPGGQGLDSTPWRCGEKYQYGSSEAAPDAWQKCHRLVKKYDNEMCDAWREEVDKLLIFAGLFSATITAFTAESYQWLEIDSDDLTSTYLSFLATEYAKAHNTTIPLSLLAPTSQTQVSSTSVRINIFWFLSLTLSLTTVLVGILCLQWLREFQRSSSPLPPKSSLALRQMRFSGLMAWHVPTILSALPVILQLSLLLFFAGLLDLLWNRNAIVAAVISVVVGLVVCFLGATTALPAFQFAFCRDENLGNDQCPYKSPQSWLFLRITQLFFRSYHLLLASWTSASIDIAPIQRVFKSATDLNWSELDMRWRRHRDASSVSWGTPKDLTDSTDIVSSLTWVHNTFGTSSPDVVLPLYHSLPDLSLQAVSILITNLYEGAPFEATTFRVMMDDRYSNNLVQKKEIVSAFYLHLHEGIHGGIVKPLYVESVVRILNSQEVPDPFLDWLSTILQELVQVVTATSPHPSRTLPKAGARQVGLVDEGFAGLGKKHSGIADEKILVQAVACAGSLAAKGARRNLDVVNALILLETLLWSTTPSSIQTTDTAKDHMLHLVIPTRPLSALNTKHITLATTLFHDLKTWITKTPNQLHLRDKIELCMEGLLKIFPDNLTVEELQEFNERSSRSGFIEGTGDFVQVLQEVGVRVGAAPGGGVRRNTYKTTRSKSHPPNSSATASLEFVKHSDDESLERWCQLVRKLSALSVPSVDPGDRG